MADFGYNFFCRWFLISNLWEWIYVQKQVTRIGSCPVEIEKSNLECGRNELPLKFQQVTLLFFKAGRAWAYKQCKLCCQFDYVVPSSKNFNPE